MTVVVLKRLIVGIAASVGMAAMAWPSPSLAAEGFYRGKQVQVLIGFGVGGSYDLYARVISRHMGKHLPGHPTMVPVSKPGAGSLIAANYIYNVAPKDGTVFGTVASGAPTAPLLFPKKAKFDATKLTWIGSASSVVYLDVLWHTAAVKSLSQLRDKEAVLGATGPGAATVDLPLMDRGLFGLKYRLVGGYKTVADIEIAMERGEVDGVSGTTWETVQNRHPAWLRDNKINIVAQYGFKKLAALPDVPMVYDLAKTDADRKAFKLVLLARQEMGKPYVAPPGLSAARTGDLRKGFLDTLSDRGFKAEAKKLKMNVLGISGGEVQKMVAELYQTPPEIVARVRGILSQPLKRK